MTAYRVIPERLGRTDGGGHERAGSTAAHGRGPATVRAATGVQDDRGGDMTTRERLLAIAADMEWEADSLLAVHARMRSEASGARGDAADGLESTCRSLYVRARRARDVALLSEL